MVKDAVINFRITNKQREHLEQEVRAKGYRSLSSLIRDRLLATKGRDLGASQELLERLLIIFQRMVWMQDQLWLESGAWEQMHKDQITFPADELKELIQRAETILEAIERYFR